MKLINVGTPGSERPGVAVTDNTWVPLEPFLAQYGVVGDTKAVLGLAPHLRSELESWMSTATPESLEGLRLGPPVSNPRTIVAVGANTHSHVAEASVHTGGHSAKTPMLIAKAATSLCGPRDTIIRPASSTKLDYETELAVVIGRAGASIRAEEALDYVGGYMACSDITARDVQVGEGEQGNFYWQHFRSKSYPTFLPTGPWIVTADEIDDLSTITLQSYVNDEIRQDSDLTDLIFDVPALIASVSECIPLVPGDILVTGSPAGVGHFMSPPGYLQEGDVLRTVVGSIGELINPVKETP